MTDKERFWQAVIDFCGEEEALRQERQMWRDLKYNHNGETVCIVDGSRELCETCITFKERSNYKGSLRKRTSYKRKMLKWFQRMNIISA